MCRSRSWPLLHQRHARAIPAEPISSDSGVTYVPLVLGSLAMSTERSSPRYSSIDLWEAEDIAESIVESQFAAVAAVQAVRKEIAAAVVAMQARLQERGRLIYVGAGTSGRLAVQDGAELGPTFGWPEERLVLLVAGGERALLRSVEGAEDDAGQGLDLSISKPFPLRMFSSQLRRVGRHALPWRAFERLNSEAL